MNNKIVREYNICELLFTSSYVLTFKSSKSFDNLC